MKNCTHELCLDIGPVVVEPRPNGFDVHFRRRVCICLDLFLTPDFFRIPPEDPLIEIEGVDPRVINDLVTLSAMSSLARRLSPEAERGAVEMVHERMRGVAETLGAGAVVSGI